MTMRKLFLMPLLLLLPAASPAQERASKEKAVGEETAVPRGKIQRGSLRTPIDSRLRKRALQRAKGVVPGRASGPRRTRSGGADQQRARRAAPPAAEARSQQAPAEQEAGNQPQRFAAPAEAPGGADATGQGDAQEGLLPGEKEFNECIKIPPRRRIKVTLKQESDLMDLVAWISSMTCKKFIVATSLRAQKVTIVSPTPVTAREAYHAFLSALEVMGLTVVPAGAYLKVVQGNWAIQSAIPTYTDQKGGRLPSSDAVVTQILQPKNVDANELLLVLNKMKSRSGDVTVYKPSNMLIITDNAANVRRMLEITAELDIETEGEKIWVIRLKSADVEEVNKILSQIFSAKGAAAARPLPRRPGTSPEQADVAQLSASKIVADPASNSLIVVATATSFARIASLIKKLDVEAEGVNQKINVYYLENAVADEMASTMGSLTGAAVSGGAAARRGRPARPQPAAQGGAATLFEGDVKISADKATNSLVIVASPRDYMNLRAVIKKLDIPRRQVFVEASIMEISLDKSRDLGFAYHGGGTVGEGESESLILGAVQHPEWSSLLLNPLAMMGLAVGARGQLIDGSGTLLGVGQDIPSFGVMFQAMQNNSNVNVLSSPHLLTTDNEEAEITVGQNIPFQGAFMGGGFGNMAGGSGSSGFGSLIPSVSVQRQDVALKLKLTPHVNESDMVRLELEQEVSDIASPNFNNLGPSTSKRTAKTVVVVRDQQTVVIGGLMGDRVQNTVNKVPLLGDIPILGYLFKYTSKTVQKTNLLIVLTPYVIRDQSDLRRIFERKLEERREFIERHTSFEAREIDQNIDYRHKRGLLAEIAKVAEQAELESKLLQEAKHTLQEDVDPVDMPEGMAPAAPGEAAPGGEAPSGAGSPPSEAPAPPPQPAAPAPQIQ